MNIHPLCTPPPTTMHHHQSELPEFFLDLSKFPLYRNLFFLLGRTRKIWQTFIHCAHHHGPLCTTIKASCLSFSSILASVMRRMRQHKALTALENLTCICHGQYWIQLGLFSIYLFNLRVLFNCCCYCVCAKNLEEDWKFCD